jgi:hypothetical protein
MYAILQMTLTYSGAHADFDPMQDAEIGEVEQTA